MKENVASLFSKNLISLRNSRKLTQAELAEALDLSLRAIQRYESGIHLPNTEIIDRVAGIFDVSVSSLFSTAKESEIRPSDNISQKNTKPIFQMLANHSELIELLSQLPQNSDLWAQFVDMVQLEIDSSVEEGKEA